MYYKEWLCVRRSLIVLSIGLVALLGIVGIVALVHVNVGGKPDTSPQGMTGFVDFFGITALLAGGIMATILGTALARENDDHLEVAWTKPVSRTEYASTVMLVDAAGILIAICLGLVFHALIHVELRQPISMQTSAADVSNTVRFLLFPFAWYALIVALSARLRGGGIVQALVWPVAFVLLGSQAIPWGPVWHTLTGLLNVINPLTYIRYQEAGLSIMTSRGMTSAITADVALVLLAIGGWAVATMQWRRLEA